MNPENTALALFELSENEADDQGRGHLGASQIGEKCTRKLFYGFRWCSTSSFTGRILRLFRRGHLEESILVSDLANLPGVTVRTIDPETGEQYRFSDPELPGFAGSIDGIAYGLPEAPDQWIGLEIKTHNTKNFAALKKHGVESAYPKHFYQVQSYMFQSSLPAFLYLGLNKNDDHIYPELIPYDAAAALMARSTAHEVLTASAPPPKISQRADWFECKPAFCSHSEICHFKKKPAKSCRSCEHVNYNPKADKWNCMLNLKKHGTKKPLDLEAQRAACNQYNPDPQIWKAG